MSDEQRTTTQAVDGAVVDLIDNITKRGRGSTLDLAATCRDDLVATRDRLRGMIVEMAPGPGGEIAAIADQIDAALAATSIEVRETLAPIDDWERPADVRCHGIHDTDSFIGYAEKYGNNEKSLVLYCEEYAQLVIDEQPGRGDRERITMKFEPAADLVDWSQVLGEPIKHRDLLKFLLAHEHNLDSADLLSAVSTVKFNAQVSQESDIKELDSQVGVMVKTNAGEDLKKFPKSIGIHIPVLDQDIDPGEWYPVTVRVQIVMPEQPTGPVTFLLRCPEFALIKRKRVTEEGKKIAEALKDWTVLHGKHETTHRNIGHPCRQPPMTVIAGGSGGGGGSYQR